MTYFFILAVYLGSPYIQNYRSKEEACENLALYKLEEKAKVISWNLSTDFFLYEICEPKEPKKTKKEIIDAIIDKMEKKEKLLELEKCCQKAICSGNELDALARERERKFRKKCLDKLSEGL